MANNDILTSVDKYVLTIAPSVQFNQQSTREEWIRMTKITSKKLIIIAIIIRIIMTIVITVIIRIIVMIVIIVMTNYCSCFVDGFNSFIQNDVSEVEFRRV